MSVIIPFDEDAGDAVGIEVGGGEDEVARAVGEGRALEIGAQADFGPGRKIGGGDGKCEDTGAVGTDLVDAGIVGLVGHSDLEAFHRTACGDGSATGEPGEDVAGGGLVDVHGESTRAGRAACRFIPGQRLVCGDIQSARQARQRPSPAVPCKHVE